MVKLNLFFDYKKIFKNNEDFVRNLSKDITNSKIGYAGFKEKIALEKFLLWNIFGLEYNLTKKKINKKEVIKIINNTLKNNLLNHKNLNIFIFPTFNKFYLSKLKGVSGFCIWRNTIIILIHPNSNYKLSLKQVLLHELAHAVSPYYFSDKTLGDWIILDGIAESFQEDYTKKKSFIIKTSKKESFEILKKIKNNLKVKSNKLHKELFYGGKKYPLWVGYSIGYYIMQDYLKKQKKVDWNKIIKTPPKKILIGSDF